MKTALLTTVLALTSLTLTAQTSTTVRAPVVSFVEIPVQPATIVTNVTNVFITTNVTVIVTNAPTPFTTITSDVIDQKLGERLMRFVDRPQNFTFTNFSPGTFTTLYWINPAGFKLNFQTNNVWWLGAIPTNQARGAVLIEAVGQEFWIEP